CCVTPRLFSCHVDIRVIAGFVRQPHPAQFNGIEIPSVSWLVDEYLKNVGRIIVVVASNCGPLCMPGDVFPERHEEGGLGCRTHFIGSMYIAGGTVCNR